MTDGDEIVSGCINITGVLKIRTTKAFGESTVSKILELVENSSSHKSKSENFISKFARVYTPAVCAAALAWRCCRRWCACWRGLTETGAPGCTAPCPSWWSAAPAPW